MGCGVTSKKLFKILHPKKSLVKSLFLSFLRIFMLRKWLLFQIQNHINSILNLTNMLFAPGCGAKKHGSGKKTVCHSRHRQVYDVKLPYS